MLDSGHVLHRGSPDPVVDIPNPTRSEAGGFVPIGATHILMSRGRR